MARLAVAALLAAGSVYAQDRPLQYSLTRVLAGLTTPTNEVTTTIHRDGDMVSVEKVKKTSHTRELLDFGKQVRYLWDPDGPAGRCTVIRPIGDWEDDPFTSPKCLLCGVARKIHGAVTETIAGIEAKLMSLSTPDLHETFWTDPRSGLILKWALYGAEPLFRLESKQFSTDKPAESVFALPAACLAAGR